MDPIFATVVLFLGFYITIIALHHKSKEATLTAIKTLGKLSSIKLSKIQFLLFHGGEMQSKTEQIEQHIEREQSSQK